ncbi:MAG: hypothetical protein C0504_11155 [Candidatus Solibacter sp.]|nr:hypothetical protein [Candidatus Solibacter sp.]
MRLRNAPALSSSLRPRRPLLLTVGYIVENKPQALPNTTRTNQAVPDLGRALRFRCQPGCIRCCDNKGFVYLTEADLIRIAGALKLTPAQFESHYVYRTRRTLRLRSPRRRNCQFLTSNGCSIHPVKPEQCRAYPFWPEILASHDRWLAESAACPGIGMGHLYQIETALDTAARMNDLYPWQYSR